MRGLISQATPAASGVVAFLLGLAFAASPAAAQTPTPRRAVGPASNWGSIFIVAYPGIGHFNSPVGADNSTATQTWNFGSGIGLGLAAAHVIGSAAQVGIEASLAPSV